MITVAVLGLLVTLAMPSYLGQIKRSSRTAAQTELVELAGLQEKVYLNSTAFSNSVTGNYNGTSTGGLGVTSGKTRDGRYTLTVSVSTDTFTLTAEPVAGSSQAGDGNLTINAQGTRTWGTKTW
jgi:type IV pilus assembly protein PilE